MTRRCGSAPRPPAGARIVLLGAGAHARVVADVLRARGIGKPPYTAVDLSTVPWRARAPGRRGGLPGGWPARRRPAGPLRVVDWAALAESIRKRGRVAAVPAIGDNRLREETCRRLKKKGVLLQGAAHPSSVVSPRARLEPGAVICAGAVVGPGARIGRGTLINTGAQIDHDGRIGDFAHVAPGAVLGGNVSVGTRAWVGLGARVREGIRIGADAVVGAGAVVVRNVPPGTIVAGIPARPLRHEKTGPGGRRPH